MNVYMSQEERNLISKYLGYDKVMLEWGAGDSTLFFSQYVKEYISIEHKKEWYDEIKPKINRRRPDNRFDSVNNIKLHYVKPNLPPSHPRKPEEFLDYINYVDVLNKKYDIVLVDGRVRPHCAYKVIPYLNENAVVFIHDFWQRRSSGEWARSHYHWILEHYKEIESIKRGQGIVALRLQ